MSGNLEHSSATRRQRLNLSAFKIVPVKLITEKQILIRDLLFGGGAASTDVEFEINPISGYVSYRHTKKLYREEERKNLALPPTKQAATLAAKTFLSERYRVFATNQLFQQSFANTLTKGKPLAYPFSMIPPMQWLKHAGTHLVKNDKHQQPDHWLCKFQVELETPDRKKLPVLNSSLDVRIGETAGGEALNYEVVGFQSRWRPIYESYRVEQFLPDTAEPEHDPADEQTGGHVHLDEFTLLSYLLADENVPQFNLLPYEATVSGEHHLSVLPASKDSLWVELNVRKINGKYKVQALVMGGSGNYQAHWGFWDPYGFEFKDRNQASKKPIEGLQ
jgi:hypothetical protein